MKNEQGSTLVWFAAGLAVVVIGIAALVIDVGQIRHLQSDIQTACNAGALAGASALPYGDAYNRAWDITYANGYEATEINIKNSQLFECEVIVEYPFNTWLAPVLGITEGTIVMSATAVSKHNICGLQANAFPFGLINPAKNNDPLDDLEDFNYGRPYIIGYGEDNVMVDDWVNGSLPVSSHPDGDGNARGWRGVLGLDSDGTYGNTGAVDLWYVAQYGWDGEMNIDDEVPAITGNMANPMDKTRDYILGNNYVDWDDFDIKADRLNSRVVYVPIIHLINESRRDEYTVQDYANGAAWDHDTVVVDGFAPFFVLTEIEQRPYLNVEGKSHDWLLGFFIPGVETIDAIPGDCADNGLYALPRLVS